MNLKEDLKSLELDLGKDPTIVVGSSRLYMRGDIIRDLSKRGVEFKKPGKGAYASGEFRDYIKTHLTEGTNLVTIGESVEMNSQFDGRSIIFNYYNDGGKVGKIYLDAKEVTDPRKHEVSKKVDVPGLEKLIAASRAEYGPHEGRFFIMASIKPDLEIKKGTAYADKEATPKPKTETAAPSKINGGWDDIMGKRRPEDFERASKIESVKIRQVEMKDFPLELLEKVFFFPRYQRKTPVKHALDILESFLMGKVKGIKVSTTEMEPMKGKSWGRYSVDDGKNRLLVLKAARDYFGYEKFTIYNDIYVDQKGNEVFERLNLGKPVNANDRVNAIDDESIPFFNVLRPHLVQYYEKKVPNRPITFSDLGYAHMYFKTNEWHPKTADLRKMIPEIPKKEAEKAVPFAVVINENGPGFWTRKPILRNLYSVFMSRDMSEDELRRAMKIISKDRGEIFSMSRASTQEDFQKAYRIISKVADRVGA